MANSRIDEILQRIRQQGDCQLQDARVIGPGFLTNAPHRVGIAHLMLRPRFALLDPTGTGKTPQSLIAYGLLKEKGQQHLRLVVVASKSALYQWQDAVKKFLTGVSAEVVGYDERRRQITEKGRRAHWALSEADILITTYTSMARDIDTLFAHLDNFVVIFDEAQRLRSHTQRMIRPAALKLSYKARCVWGLSATPIHNRLEDLHGIFEVVRPGLLGSLRHFQDCYLDRTWVKFGQTGKGFWYVKGYKNIGQLMAILQPYYLKRKAEDIDQYLPPVVFQDVRLSMTDRQRELYRDIKKLKFPMGGGATTAIQRIASLAYLQQASDCPEVLGEQFEGIGSSKVDELVRFLTEEVENEHVIVYSKYERVVTHLTKTLAANKIGSVRITGKETAAQRDRAKQAFNSGEQRVILLDSAGGEALDLQSAAIVVFFDLPWSWGELQQVIGRARRIGSPHQKILVVMLINTGTLDVRVLNLLEKKEDVVTVTVGIDDGQTLSAPPDITTRQLYDLVRDMDVRDLDEK